MVKEIDLGKDLEKVVTMLKGEYGKVFTNVSGDIWNVLLDKAEAEAYDKIKMVPKGQGVVAYGVLYVPLVHGCVRFGFGRTSPDVDAPGPAQTRGGVGGARGDVAGQDAAIKGSRRRKARCHRCTRSTP